MLICSAIIQLGISFNNRSKKCFLEVVIGKWSLFIVRDCEAVLCGVENLQYLGGQGIGSLGTLLDDNLGKQKEVILAIKISFSPSLT